MKTIKRIVSLIIVFQLIFISTRSYAASMNTAIEEMSSKIHSDAVLIMEESTRKSNI